MMHATRLTMRARLTGAASLVVLSSLAVPAMAQQAAASGTQLEEVVVQARRVDENLQDVPLAVTALSQEVMREKSINSIMDLKRAAPGVQTTQSPRSDDNVRFTIRGQSQAEVVLTSDSSVGVYIDGIYQSRIFGTRASLFDIDRVEVLKGPQGTLYGKNTTGGAVNIFTRQARIDETGGYAQATVGRFGSVNVQGAANMPLIAGKLAGRLAANYDHYDGFAEDRAGRPMGNRNAYSVRGMLTAQPTEELQIRLMAGYTKIRGNGPFVKVLQVVPTSPAPLEAGLQLGGYPSIAAALAAGQTTASLAARGLAFINQQLATAGRYNSGDDQTAVGDPLGRFDGYDGALTVSWDLAPEFTLKSLTGYKRHKRQAATGLDGTVLQIVSTLNGSQAEAFSQEFNLTGNLWDGRLAVVGGAFYSDEDGTDFGVNAVLPRVSGNERTISNVDVNNKSAGVYGQATFKLTEQLSLTGGLRYSEDRRKIATQARGISLAGVVSCNVPRPSPTAACNYESPTLKSNAMSYTLSAAYAVTDDVNVYGVTRRGYRAGGWNVGTTATQPPIPFQPEFVTDYEVGLKTQLFGNRARFNIAAYTSDYKDIQKSTIVALPTGTTVSAIANAATATIRGVEADLLARITPAFQIDATLAYTDAYYRDFRVRNPTTGALLSDRTSEPFEVPKWTYSLGAKYTWDMPVGSASARVDWYWQDTVIFSQQAALLPTERVLRQPSYGLIGARLSWEIPEADFTVSLVGRNLANKHFYMGGTDVRVAGPAFVQIGEPRWVGMEFRKNFGGQ